MLLNAVVCLAVPVLDHPSIQPGSAGGIDKHETAAITKSLEVTYNSTLGNKVTSTNFVSAGSHAVGCGTNACVDGTWVNGFGHTCSDLRRHNEGGATWVDVHGTKAGHACCQFCGPRSGCGTTNCRDGFWMNGFDHTCSDLRRHNEGNALWTDISGNQAGESCCQFCEFDSVTLTDAIYNFVELGANAIESSHGPIANWDVSRVTEMSLFKHVADRLLAHGRSYQNMQNFNADLSRWDVSKVTNMESMFEECTSFNADLSKWDVSKVTNMKNMFLKNWAFNQDLSRWDVSEAIDMSSMFWGCHKFNSDLSNWAVDKVTTMEQMFTCASIFDQDLSKWDTLVDFAKVEHSYMFSGQTEGCKVKANCGIPN